jgi:hypothetical protein
MMELAGQPGVVPEDVKLTALMGSYVLIGVSLHEPYGVGDALAFIRRRANKLASRELPSRKFARPSAVL